MKKALFYMTMMLAFSSCSTGTKEVKEESNISVQQLLLENMIQSENIAGGIEEVKLCIEFLRSLET